MSVSRQSVHELITRGILTRGDDGLIDIEEARTAIASRVRPGAKSAAIVQTADAAAAAPAPAPEPAAATPPSADATPASNDAAATSFHVARTLRETAEAELSQIKLRIARGQVLDAASTLRAITAANHAIKAEVLSLPDRMTPLVAQETDPRKVHQLIQTECERLVTRMHESAQRMVQKMVETPA